MSHKIHLQRKAEFEDIFHLYGKGLVVYAKKFVDTTEEAEDIVHDVFVRFWEKIGVLERNNIKSYLFTAVRNRCLDYISGLRVRMAYKEKLLKEKSEYAPNIDLFVEGEVDEIIARALDKLSPQRRRVFIMSRFEQKSYSLIAEELDISPRTVDNHLQLATKSLREELKVYADLLALFIAVFI